MNSRQESIQTIIDLCRKHGLFTNSESTLKVIDRFNTEDGDVYVILTSGEPTDTNHCSQCKEILQAEVFSYYQARVDKHGYLARSNALCARCSKKINKKTKAVLDQAKDKIPPKPKAGMICPKCNRGWTGNWHRHHDHKTNEFIEWLCGQCNMSSQDRRTPHAYQVDESLD